MFAIGYFLLVQATWAVFERVRVSSRHNSSISLSLVSPCGDIVGEVCDFPGSTMSVWNGLLGRSKEGRAFTQFSVLLSQVIAIPDLPTAHCFQQLHMDIASCIRTSGPVCQHLGRQTL